MKKTTLAIIIAGAFQIANCLGQEERPELALTLENDKFLLIDHTDRHYTHGTLLSYWAGESGTNEEPTLFRWIPSVGLNVEPTHDRFGFVLSQKIFTPSDLTKTTLIPTDRPYAGWLYGGFRMRRTGEALTLPAMDTFEFDLGVIGPSAHGGDVQNFVHRVIHVGEAQGWNNQLDDEVAFNFHTERSFLISGKEHPWVSWDLIPTVGMDLGTVRVAANLGAQIRAGYNLPNDFHSRESKNWGFYGFAGIDGHIVGRNLFLDGNTFTKSHHVDKLPLVADLSLGFVLKTCKHFELSYTYVYRTREFEQQVDEDRFGSITCRFWF